MKKINSNFLFPVILLITLIFVLSEQMFIVPPLGKLLNPFIGAVQNGINVSSPLTKIVMDKQELSDSVTVFFDNRNVPHIFANNEKDMFFVQGYVTASLRLWQMDFLSYVSAGRLSEILKKDECLDYDRRQRRIGILKAAKKSLELMNKDLKTKEVLSAYTKGVNAYINQLSYETTPLEYKLLDYAPEPWTDLKTVLILKYMGSTLSGYDEDLVMSNMILALGEKNFNKIFPDYNSHSSPVMNNDSSMQYSSSTSYLKTPGYLNNSFLLANSIVERGLYNPKLGSNNWAVSGKKTKSGFPILCNDPHLGLSFPCIWLEMQISSPGVNVYGVSIPGTPAIIIGFNERIAWGVTNGATDVKDWYKLKITDDYKKYELDGKWVNLSYEIEEIKRKGQKSFYDTVFSTIHGPIVYNSSFDGLDIKKTNPSYRRPIPLNYSLRWELHNPSNEFLTFIKLNRGKNYKDFTEAITHYSCPIQNFVFACKDNTIAINHQGKLPVKWIGQGKFVLDGTRSSHLYAAYIPNDSLPHLLNPECNYVFSANQRPTYASYPYYYNGRYWEPRANRIQKLLERENKFDIQKMQLMQLDNLNAFAADATLVLVACIDKNKLTKEERTALTNFRVWTGTYDLHDINAELFELWWKNISDFTWDELKAYPFSFRVPDNYVLLDLIRNEPTNAYFDKQGTSQKENAEDIIREAFVVALKEYYKIKAEKGVRWGDCNKVNIMHLTNIPALSKTNLSSAGYPDAINAVSSNWGPSWRMIVELGDRPKAYGVYPGGQSGNAGSFYYDNFVDFWNKGKFYELQFYILADEAREHAMSRWILK